MNVSFVRFIFIVMFNFCVDDPSDRNADTLRRRVKFFLTKFIKNKRRDRRKIMDKVDVEEQEGKVYVKLKEKEVK